MRRVLLPILASLAISFAAGAAHADTPGAISKAERRTVRMEIKTIANAHIVASGNRYERPTVSIPIKSMVRTNNGGIQATATIHAFGIGWSPIPQRLAQETATFVKVPGKEPINTTGWQRIINGLR